MGLLIDRHRRLRVGVDAAHARVKLKSLHEQPDLVAKPIVPARERARDRLIADAPWVGGLQVAARVRQREDVPPLVEPFFKENEDPVPVQV